MKELLMSETLTLPDAPTIRRTADGQISVFDALEVMGAKQPRVMWRRLVEAYPEVSALATMHQFPGPGQRETPVVAAADAAQITQFLKRVAPVEVAGEQILAKILKRKEILFGEVLDAVFGWKHDILRQYAVEGYRLDFYMPSIKLAIEHDGPEHARTGDQDRQRQEVIEAALGCKFVRVDARNEMEGLRIISRIVFGGDL